MPSGLVFHEGYTFTLNCLHNDCCRHSLDCSCLVKCSLELIHIISVFNIDHMEIKCLKFLIDRIRRADFINFTINLKSVIVHDHYQVVQFTEACKHSRLPYLTFLNLTISQESIYSVSFIAEFCRKCHTYCCGDSLSQRTTRHINTRDMFHIRMSLQIRSKMTKCLQIFFREISSLSQCRVKSRCCMSFGEYKTVSVCFLRIFRVNVHFLKIQVCE